jgi:glycosyltransferase involved in cell wall biosynthesis
MQETKKKILVFTDWFEPGFKAGGPIRSCVNFAFHMKSDYDVFIFTSDRDLGDTQAYQGIETNSWTGKAAGLKLFYASPAFLTWKNIIAMIKSISPDFIYLNSMFSKYFALYPLLMKRFAKLSAKIILAPRGMLRASALAFKASKKKVFLGVFNALKIPSQLHFHATDTTELNDIKKLFGEKTSVTEVSNFPGAQRPFRPLTKKEPGHLKMIYTGRIHPIKNLSFLLGCLQSVSYKVDFTVVAAIEDEAYWNICREMISKLASHINVELMSNVPHAELENILLQHHLFVLPSKGENFSHAIYESLAAGRPVLISDQTPWRNLEGKMAGWDLSLDEPSGFTAIINKVAAMDLEELNTYCRQAWQYCNDFITHSNIKTQYLKLFS